jgi:hypothetical protein
MMRKSARQDEVTNGESRAFGLTMKLAAPIAFHLDTVQVAREEELRWRKESLRATALIDHRPRLSAFSALEPSERILDICFIRKDKRSQVTLDRPCACLLALPIVGSAVQQIMSEMATRKHNIISLSPGRSGKVDPLRFEIPW